MEDRDGEVHSETDEARAGSTPHIVRWILAISLFAAIALLSIVWITGALTQGDAEQSVNVSDRVHEMQEDQDDGFLTGAGMDDIDNPERAVGAPATEGEDPARTIPNQAN